MSDSDSDSDADAMYTKQPNNNWTKAKEDKLLEWQQQSRLHSLGHSRAQEIFAKRNNKMMIPSIVIGAIATFMDGVALLWEEHRMPFIITALLLTAITTIITGILQATKPIEVAASHEEMAKGYNRIILQIDAMFAKEYKERMNGTRFLSKIEEELINLKTGVIKIPDAIWISVKEEFIAAEGDFQKMLDDQAFGALPKKPVTEPVDKPSINETIVDLDTATDSVIDVSVNNAVANEPSPVDNAGDPMVDVSGTVVPRFELKIHNDPKMKKMNKLFYDYQFSRFG